MNVSGPINQTLTFTTASLTLEEVPSGTYAICITVDGVEASEFERCYSISVEQPSPLSVYGKVAPTGKSVHYDLSGGDVYTIFHNGKSIQTDEQSIDIDLDEGINQIRITTGIECQGIFEEEYFNSAEVFYTLIHLETNCQSISEDKILPSPLSYITHKEDCSKQVNIN